MKKKFALPWTGKKLLRGFLGFLIYCPLSALCMSLLPEVEGLDHLTMPLEEIEIYLLALVFPALVAVVSMFCRKALQPFLFSLILLVALWAVVCYLAGILWEVKVGVCTDLIILPFFIIGLFLAAPSVGEAILIIFR